MMTRSRDYPSSTHKSCKYMLEYSHVHCDAIVVIPIVSLPVKR